MEFHPGQFVYDYLKLEKVIKERGRSFIEGIAGGIFYEKITPAQVMVCHNGQPTCERWPVWVSQSVVTMSWVSKFSTSRMTTPGQSGDR